MDNLPPLLKDFIKSVAPDPVITPVVELEQRFLERKEEERRANIGLVPTHIPRDSVEYMVEMRIREWVMRMEAEKREIEARRRAEEKAKNAGPTAPPPPPAGKKIAPPKR